MPLRAARPRAGSASTPAARPSTAASTSATRARSWSSACSSASSSTRATTVTLVVNVTDVNDKIYAAARGRLRAPRSPREMTAAYVADTDAPRARAPRPRAAGVSETIAADRRVHRGADRARPRLRAPAATSTSACARDPGYGALSHRALDDDGPGRGASRAPSASRTRSTSRCGRRTSRARTPAWDAPWGRGPPGLAHRVLGDGREPARRRLRHPRRRLGPALPPPRERGRADARRARRASSRGSGCTTACSSSTGEKMAKSVGNIAPLHEVLDAHGRDARGHVLRRRPLPPADGVLGESAARQAPRARAPHPRGGAPAVAGSLARPDLARCATRFFAALADDFNTPRRSPRCTSGSARPTAARRRVGDGDLREMLGVLGLENLLDARRAAAPDARSRALLPQRERARARRDFARADALREQIEVARLGGARRPDGGFELIRRCGDRLRAQRRARGAARAPRARPSARCWATEAPRASRGSREARRARSPRPRRSSERCGSRAHQGICAQARRLSRTSRRASCCAAQEPLIVALDEVQDPQNLGAICRTAECAGATGVVIPERRAAEVTPAVCKASAGAVEHLRDRARAQPRRLPRRGPRGAGCWCYGASASARRRDRPTTAPDYRGGVVLVLGSEGRGLRPRVAAACDAARRAAAAGADRVARRQRRRGRAAVRDLARPRAAP